MQNVVCWTLLVRYEFVRLQVYVAIVDNVMRNAVAAKIKVTFHFRATVVALCSLFYKHNINTMIFFTLS